MNKEELVTRIEKIFRANTIEVERVVGQFDQKKMFKEIGDIQELKDDIITLLSDQYNKGKIDKKEIFIGTGKIGASYSIEVAIKVAKEWGFKYVVWNDGAIIKLNGEYTNLKYDEL